MTEPAEVSASTPSKRKRYVRWGVALLVLLLVGGVFLASRAGLDKALVKQQLDDFIARAKQQAQDKGRDLEITYGDLSVVGSFARKHVEVQNVVVKVKPRNSAAQVAVNTLRPNSSLQISTARVDIFPTTVDMSSMRVELPQPVDFSTQEAPEKSLMNVRAAAPLVLSIAQSSKGDQRYHRTEYRVPENMDFTYLREQQVKGEEDTAPTLTAVYETLNMQIVGGGAVVLNTAEGTDLGDARIAFGKITLTPKSAPEGVVTIAGIQGEYSNVLNEAKQNVMLTKLNAGPLEAPAGLVPLAPISLQLDASYTGAIANTAEAVASIESQQSIMQLKQFSLTLKEAAVNASADFAANASDVLPVGKAMVVLKNVPLLMAQLKENHLLNPAQLQLVEPLLPQITGTKLEEIKDADIAILRERGGAFKIGNSTFEELFAAFLRAAMVHKQQGVVTPATQLPDAAKPKTTPIELHDQSTRG